MKFSHFAFETPQQVDILVHIRAVILLVLPQNKTKHTNWLEIKRVWGTGENWDKILVNTLVKWITDWEATRFQALSLSRSLSDRRLITEQLTSTCPVIYTSDPSIVFYGISRTPYKGNYLFNRAWRSVTIDSNQCSPLVEMRMEFLQRQNSVTKTAREATVNMVQHITNQRLSAHMHCFELWSSQLDI